MNRHNVFFAISILAGLAAIIAPAAAQQQVTPTSPIILSTPIVTINNSAGDQTQPHVSQDLAAYTDVADNSVHYYNFSAGVDAAVPLSQSVSDTLSDVSGNRICFTRQTTTNDFEIAVFDTTSSSATVIDPHPGDLRIGCAFVGNTLVYVDLGTGNGDIFAYDLAANPPTPPQAISLSPNVEQNPNVSPDGNTVVWENCPNPSNCDVMKALRSGGRGLLHPLSTHHLTKKILTRMAPGSPTTRTEEAQPGRTSFTSPWLEGLRLNS